MPDWFYRTVARPCLFRLPDTLGRGLALGVIGGLGRNAAGRGVIRFMGHMEADERLAFEKRGLRFASPMGIGWRVDSEGRATEGLACFGVGCIEIVDGGGRRCRREAGEGLLDERADGVGGVADADAGVERVPAVVLRRGSNVAGQEVLRLPNGEELPVLGFGDESMVVDDERFGCGVVLQLGERLESGIWRLRAGLAGGELEAIVAWRERLGADAWLVVAGGVRGPEEACALRRAGVDLMLVDAGMVFRGPGLVKRCNEALALELEVVHEPRVVESVFRRSWLWALGLGVALFLGGVATSVLAGTRVLLPYDEHFLGMSWRELREGMPLLFGFMAHDRGTLAGTMLGLGWLYGALAWSGIRRNEHGAKTAVAASALVGFASFFAFFGFGYFDTLHAFVAAVLFQLAVQVMVGSAGGAKSFEREVDLEDWAWRMAQWGQLLWILHAVGLVLAGMVILGIGMTAVFVSEDLGYLCMTREQALGLGEKLIGVVAHDRATLGGMLLASGVASLLSSLWLFRRGARWLWWAMLGFGVPAYAASIGVHFWVGYVDWRHLVPTFAGLGIWSLGLVLSRRYLRGG